MICLATQSTKDIFAVGTSTQSGIFWYHSTLAASPRTINYVCHVIQGISEQHGIVSIVHFDANQAQYLCWYRLGLTAFLGTCQFVNISVFYQRSKIASHALIAKYVLTFVEFYAFLSHFVFKAHVTNFSGPSRNRSIGLMCRLNLRL
ncbi:hypothetical protein BpHYR1_031209 [Brachionus plicatilis]|uniref:Uncharacterized protein n=1 Tax=Brachionus plicatilis TaxID=10195 RepID=A0A3M7Q9S8_BRAPC|nr:hypothetical protein BpHYR1_031209 [Brachionus plicatilis]